MTVDLDTFLVGLYTTVDDLYQEHFAPHKPQRPGRRPELADSEVLTLTLCAQWFGKSERAFLRYATAHWRRYFPRLLSQSAYHRRVKDVSGVLVRLVGLVSQALESALAPYQAVDTVPVPLMRRCRGRRHRSFGDEAAIGRGGSDRDWYYGCKLLLAVTLEGAITGFLLAPASTEDRWTGAAFFCWRQEPAATPQDPRALPRRRNGLRYVGPTGPLWPRAGVGALSAVPYVADNGFFGAWWQTHWRVDYTACVLTPKHYADARSKAQHAGWKQVVETVNGQLEDVLGLHFPGARSKQGLLCRVAAKLAALNLGIWLNQYLGRPNLALATLLNW